MGRPAKAASLRSGHMTREEKETRTIAENILKGGNVHLTPPKHLTKEQAALFRKIYKVLSESNILSSLDVYVLGSCAIAIDRIRKYDEMIADDESYLLDKDFMSNRNKVVVEFLRYCGELCLSPQARAKIGAAVISKQSSENPTERLFDEIIGSS